jgi:hypothetical protein
MMSDDMSWIDHPANLRANAALLRAIADQSLLHADYIEQLRVTLDRLTTQLRAENVRLREALEIIAGRRQCLDNLMGNVDVACAALDGGKP